MVKMHWFFGSFRLNAQKLTSTKVVETLNKNSREVMHCVDEFAPEKNINSETFIEDWITTKLKNEISKRNKLFQKWIQFPLKANRTNYVNQRNMVTTLNKKC